MGRKSCDLTGEKYGRLTAIKSVGKNQYGQELWLFKCECGKETVVRGTAAKQSRTKSCGCLGKEATVQRCTTHGMFGTRLYNIYFCMLRRCYDEKHKSYSYYGAVGISVCDEWRNNVKSFLDWAMVNDYNDNLSIDRKDGAKGYSPDNCRWATNKEQQNNLKSNHDIEYDGKKMNCSVWANKLNVEVPNFFSAIRRYGDIGAIKHYLDKASLSEVTISD